MSPITFRLRLTTAALTVAAALSSAFLVSSAPAQSSQPVQRNAVSQGLHQVSGQAKQQETELEDRAYLLAGLTPVQGPGVIATLTDSKKRLPTMPAGIQPPNLIHDTDINQVINELKAAGAEAISVNGQRLVTTSAIRTAGPTMLVNNTPQTPPYVIKAIGAPKTLVGALNLRGGGADQLKRFDPAMFSIQQAQTLTLPAYSGSGEPRYAKPVSAGAAGTIRPQQLAALIARRNQLQVKYEKLAQPMIRYQQTFDDELRQALPQSEAQTLAKARNLEFSLGWDRADLAEMETLLQRSHEPQVRQLVENISKEKMEVAALRAEEARLFPATPQAQQHLVQVHALALHHPTKTLKLQVIALEIAMLDDQIQQLSALEASSATAAD